MQSYKICGGKMLSGKIKVEGSKNALLPIIAASILVKDIVELENVTPLEDTYAMIDILRLLNVRVIYDHKSKMIIDSRNLVNKRISNEHTSKLRASYYFMGALLALYKSVKVGKPGGCDFSTRPIDLHLFAFENLGFDVVEEKNFYTFKKEREPKQIIEFSKVSVGATVNAILASVLNKGTTILKNVAMEPEIDDLINFLNKCGSKIKREDNKIIVAGVYNLFGCNYKIMDDRIEAETYVVIGALLGRNLEIICDCKKYMNEFLLLMNKVGVRVKETSCGVIVNVAKEIKEQSLIFNVYPGLPTDIQPVLTILFTKSKGESVFEDNVYPDRFSQVDELVSMGYNLRLVDKKLLIRRNNAYLDSLVSCKDLRGGMSLIVAAILSNKTTCIKNCEYISRGYYDVINKLKRVGAHIEKI